jgi:hypothetical protein
MTAKLMLAFLSNGMHVLHCSRRVSKGFTVDMHLLLDDVSGGYRAIRPFFAHELCDRGVPRATA